MTLRFLIGWCQCEHDPGEIVLPIEIERARTMKLSDCPVISLCNSTKLYLTISFNRRQRSHSQKAGPDLRGKPQSKLPAKWLTAKNLSCPALLRSSAAASASVNLRARKITRRCSWLLTSQSDAHAHAHEAVADVSLFRSAMHFSAKTSVDHLQAPIVSISATTSHLTYKDLLS
jgi:hypothetical protein